MHYRIALLFSILIVAVSACNLGSQSPTPEVLITQTSQPVAGKPLVSITSPAEGDEFVVNEEILVSVVATDSIGVTLLRMFANDQSVKLVSSQNTNGDTSMNAVLDYAPRASGEITLRVVAFRGAIESDPAEINVTVRDRASQVVATAIPNSNVPFIPNDGVCRALVNTSLNFRNGPSTGFDRIALLDPGTLAPIIGRLGNNSWWKLRVGLQEGWVAAQFTTPYGNCANVPVLSAPLSPTAIRTATFTPTITPIIVPTSTNTTIPPATATPGKPDLVITSIVGDTRVNLPGGEAISKKYSVVITNTGFGEASSFATVLEYVGGEINLGVVGGLGAGQSITFEVNLEFDSADTYEINIRTDSDNQVTEISEVNNTASISVTVVNP